MEEEFPWKRVWFKIGVINENGYVMVFLDDAVLVRRSPDMKGDFFPDSRLDRINRFYSTGNEIFASKRTRAIVA